MEFEKLVDDYELRTTTDKNPCGGSQRSQEKISVQEPLQMSVQIDQVNFTKIRFVIDLVQATAF